MNAHATPSEPADLPLTAPGQVTLVGAGPGDPDLLTVRAVKAIRGATLLLVDDLVGVGVLAHASRAARIVHVGKRGGCRSTPQAFIERLMIIAACAGEAVVRLKGGDPFVFGRGGEEMERLRAAGIPVQVVSGLTAGLAAGAALGLPLTHRDHAHGVVFVTGHARPGDAGVDWPALAAAAYAARLTLVIYMGVAGVSRIASGLREGLPGTTPVAVVHGVSRPEQRHAACTLDALADAVARERLGSPAVIVVGEVARGLLALRTTRAAQAARAADGAASAGEGHARTGQITAAAVLA